LFCHQCGTAFRYRVGLGGRSLKFVLCAGAFIGAYYITRPALEAWAFIAFMLVLILVGAPALLLVRWYLHKYAALVPMARNASRSEAAGI
jgi:hypothetical protein